MILRRSIVAALALALATPAFGQTFISATPPQPIPVYPGCPVPPVSWTSTPGNLATNQVWYIDPVHGNNANSGATLATAWNSIAALTASVAGGGGTNAHPLLVSVDPVNGVVKSGDEVLLETGSYGAVSISPSAQATNSPEVTLAADVGAVPQMTKLTLSKTSGWVFKGLNIDQNVFPATSGAINLNSSTANNVNDITFIGNEASNHTTAAFNAFVANFQGTYTASSNTLNVTSMLPGVTAIQAGMQADWNNNGSAPATGIVIAPFGTGGTTGTGGIGTYQLINEIDTTATAASWVNGVATYTLSAPLAFAVASGITVTAATFTPAAYNGTFAVASAASAGATTISLTVPNTATVAASAATWSAAGGGTATFTVPPLTQALDTGVSVTTSGFSPSGFNFTAVATSTFPVGSTSITLPLASNPGSAVTMGNLVFKADPGSGGSGTLENMINYPNAGGPFIMSAMDPTFYTSNIDDVVRETGNVDNSSASCHNYVNNHFHNSFFTMVTTTDKLLIQGNELDHWYKSMWESYLSNTMIVKNHIHDTESTFPNHPDEIQVLQNSQTCCATFPNIVYNDNIYVEHEDSAMPFSNGSFGLVDGSKFRTPFSNLQVENNVFVTSLYDAINWSLTACFTCTIANNTIIDPNVNAPYTPTLTKGDISLTDVQFPALASATWSAGVATFNFSTNIGNYGISPGAQIYAHGFTPSGYNGMWNVTSAGVAGGATSVSVNMASNPGGSASVVGSIGFQSTGVVIRNNVANVMTITMPQASPIVDHNTFAACVGTGCGTTNLYQHWFSTDGALVSCSATCADTTGNLTQVILAQGALNSGTIWKVYNQAGLSYLFAPLSGATSVVAQGAPWDANYTPQADLYGFPWTNPPNLGAARCYNPFASGC